MRSRSVWYSARDVHYSRALCSPLVGARTFSSVDFFFCSFFLICTLIFSRGHGLSLQELPLFVRYSPRACFRRFCSAILQSWLVPSWPFWPQFQFVSVCARSPSVSPFLRLTSTSRWCFFFFFSLHLVAVSFDCNGSSRPSVRERNSGESRARKCLPSLACKGVQTSVTLFVVFFLLVPSGFL